MIGARRILGALAGTAVLAVLPAVGARAVTGGDPTFGTGAPLPPGVSAIDFGHKTLDTINVFNGELIAGSADNNMALIESPANSYDQRLTVDFGVPSAAYAFGGLASPANSLVVGGSAGDDFGLAAFEWNHSYPHTITPTRTFGGEGRVRVSFGAPSVVRALQSSANGSVVAAGTTDLNGGSVALAMVNGDGSLVQSFGAGGKVVTDLTPGRDAAYAAIGFGGLMVGGQAGDDAFLARYNDDGTLDPTFGIGGVLLLPLSAGPDAVTSLVQFKAGPSDPSDRILVAGRAGDDAFVASIYPDGRLDPAFGTGGIVRTRFGAARAAFTSVAFYFQNPTYDPAGVLVGGTVTAANGATDAVAAWFTFAGTPDTEFAGRGYVVRDLGGPNDHLAGAALGAIGAQQGYRAVRLAGDNGADGVTLEVATDGSVPASTYQVFEFGRPAMGQIREVAAQPDGKLVVAGRTGYTQFIARFLANGRLDPAFRPGHLTWPELGPIELEGLALQPDGKIVMGGVRRDHSLVVRLLPDGSPDPSFGVRGVADYPNYDPYTNGPGRLLLQPDGRIVVFGAGKSLTFDSSGQVVAKPTAPFTSLSAAFQRDDLVTALTAGDYGGLVLRTHLDGSADPTYEPIQQYFDAIAVYDDNRILGTSATAAYSHPRDVVVQRWLASGAKDPSFGVNGAVTLDLGVSETASNVLLQPDGKILVVADDILSIQPTTVVVRLLPNGAVDTTFADNGRWTQHEVRGRALLQPDGKLVLAGHRTGIDGVWTPAIIRFAPGSPAGRPAYGWGFDFVGQVGDGTAGGVDYSPVPVLGLPDAVAVAAGAYHSLALRADGTVWAWGWNPVGQLGDGTNIDRAAPVRVQGLTDVVAIAAGAYHSLALRADGTVWAWGWNGVGQLGDGTTVDRWRPQQVAGLAGIRSIAAGGHHNLAAAENGDLWAWGWNALGQLGDGTTLDRWRPVMAATEGINGVSAGTFHSLAIQGNGTVLSWGYNGQGQLGRTGDSRRPGTVPGLPLAATVAAGGFHSLALGNDGSVWAWGWNGVGQVGDGTTVDRAAPVAVGVPPSVRIAVGSHHSLAVGQDGRLRAWGWNGAAQLGDGTTTDRSRPVVVPMPAGALNVAAGVVHTFAF